MPGVEKEPTLHDIWSIEAEAVTNIVHSLCLSTRCKEHHQQKCHNSMKLWYSQHTPPVV